MCSGRLHAPYVRAIVVRIGCGRWRSLPCRTTKKQQEQECRSEPAWQVQHVIYSPQNGAASFDHLIGKIEHAWRHRETQRLGGFEVDDQ
jgi:hypothetical protein